jgi:CHAT domain-containing protein
MILGYCGQVSEAQGRLAEAMELTRRALMSSSSGLDPGLEMLWNWQLGRLLERTGEFQQTDARYRAAFTLASEPRFEESIPAGLPVFCGHERPQDMFRDFADFLLAHGDQVRASPEAAWRDALAIMDSRRELRIRDFLQDQCLASLVGREKSIESIAPGSAILHILVLPNRTELLLQVQERIFRNVIDVPQKDFYNQVSTFRQDLRIPTATSYRESGKKLYDWIIRPFERQLTEAAVDTLVVATDGELQLVPFGALYDGNGFLIQRMAVASTPSLHLLDARTTQTRSASILGVGLKTSVRLNEKEFPALTGVDRELGSLQSLPVHSTIMVDSEFTPHNFQQALADTPFSIVHVVSHAEVGSDPEDFFIVTDQGTIDLDGLDQAIRPTLYRQKPLELLVLSACETAVGDDRIALGLAGVALKAGARSTLASLWSANDQSSTAVMMAFYAHWFSKESPSKAQALRQAQLGLLQDPRYRHPRFWAPYILIGNWQ